jgi:hypothetical protein
MLLNLTNHPSTRWSDKQLAAAREAYGEVQDLQFPNIPSEMSGEEVDDLAEVYYHRVVISKATAVHLQGEMAFTYALVRRLRAHNIPVVASTSERLVEERDGKKIIQFNFVRFRAYR